MPALSALNSRTAGEGSDAWSILFRAWKERDAGRDVIVMAVGDPDFSTPQPIIDAAKTALDAGHTHYVQIPGLPALREAVAKEMMRVSGATPEEYSLTAGNVMIMPGTQNALFAASLTLLDPGDEVIALDPMYVTYQATFEVNGATLVRAPCRREDGFRPDPAAVEALVTSRTKALVITNPNNPTGVVLDRGELEALADIARRHDLWVIADEVYATQTFDKPHFSIAALPGMAERTVTCSSLSKAQAMTGWRIGWICGPEDVIRHCDNLGLAMHYGVAAFIQHASVEALGGSLPEIRRMVEIYRKRCAIVVEGLSNLPGIRIMEPEGGMYVLVDVTGTGLASGEFASRLFEAEGVALLDATPFGKPAEGCVRIAFTISEQALAEGCTRIRRFIASLQPGTIV